MPQRITSTIDWVIVNIITGLYLTFLSPQFLLSLIVGLSVICFNIVKTVKKYQEWKYAKEDHDYIKNLKENINKEEINKRLD